MYYSLNLVMQLVELKSAFFAHLTKTFVKSLALHVIS